MRSLVILEQLYGTLFVATLIARLAGFYPWPCGTRFVPHGHCSAASKPGSCYWLAGLFCALLISNAFSPPAGICRGPRLKVSLSILPVNRNGT